MSSIVTRVRIGALSMRANQNDSTRYNSRIGVGLARQGGHSIRRLGLRIAEGVKFARLLLTCHESFERPASFRGGSPIKHEGRILGDPTEWAVGSSRGISADAGRG